MINLLRVLFVALGAGFPALFFLNNSLLQGVVAAGVGAVVSLILLIVTEYVSHTFSARAIVAVITGLLVGSAVGYAVQPVPSSG